MNQARVLLLDALGQSPLSHIFCLASSRAAWSEDCIFLLVLVLAASVDLLVLAPLLRGHHRRRHRWLSQVPDQRRGVYLDAEPDGGLELCLSDPLPSLHLRLVGVLILGGMQRLVLPVGLAEELVEVLRLLPKLLLVVDLEGPVPPILGEGDAVIQEGLLL